MNTPAITLNKTTTINCGIIFLNAADCSTRGSQGVIFRSGYDVPNNNNHIVVF
jgi:hypothetical protein